MKIVDVCAFYTPHGGGVKTYIDQKLRIGTAMGHEIVIIAPGTEDRVEARAEGGKIVHLAAPALPLDRRYRYFNDPARVHALLDTERPDMVEASSPWRTASIVADWRGDAPRALIMHADPLAAYPYRWFGAVADRPAIDRQFAWFWNHLRRAAARCDMVVSANAGLSRRLQMGGVPAVSTIPLGIDPGTFSPSLRDEGIRRDLLARCGLDGDAMLLLGIGRHAPEKRWPMVIDACLRAGVRRKIGLVLIGEGRDEARLRRHVGASPHIHLLAPIRDRALLARVMASGDALIHGCEAETYGLVAAEAAASGLPLIVPSDGGAADLATVETAETYRAGDVHDATRAIVRLARRQPAAAASAAAIAAERVGTMDEHFARLFTAYGGFARIDRIAA
jgi:alpha-1,6-mannosyltransferase